MALAGGTKQTELIAAGQSADWLIKTSVALVKAYEVDGDEESGSPEALKRLRDVLSRCGDAMERRNAVVHGYPTVSPEEGGMTFYRSRWRQAEPAPTERGHLRRLNDDLQHLPHDLMMAALACRGLGRTP